MDILQERPEPLPQCDQCGMHMPSPRIFKHCQSYKCNEATERRLQRSDVEMADRCREIEFSLEGG